MNNGVAISSVEEKTHCPYFKRSISREKCVGHFKEKIIRDLGCIGGNCPSPFKPYGVCKTCISQSVQKPAKGVESEYYFTKEGEEQCPFHATRGPDANPETEILMGHIPVEEIGRPEKIKKKKEGGEMKQLTKTEAKVYEALREAAKAGKCGAEEKKAVMKKLDMTKEALAFQIHSLKNLEAVEYTGEKGVTKVNDIEYETKESSAKAVKTRPRKKVTKSTRKYTGRKTTPEGTKELGVVSSVLSPSIGDILNLAFSGNGSGATNDVYEAMVRNILAHKCTAVAGELKKVATAFEKIGGEIKS